MRTQILKSILFLGLFASISIGLKAQSACMTTIELAVNVQICNAIQEISGLTAVTIAPNPSQGQFDLSFTTEQQRFLQIELLDGLKRILY